MSAEITDMREPGEAFCSDCPDHEACMTNWPCSLVKRVARRMTCPRCNGAGIVDTSPPGVDRHPWLATDIDCPRCCGTGEIPDTDTEESTL